MRRCLRTNGKVEVKRKRKVNLFNMGGQVYIGVTCKNGTKVEKVWCQIVQYFSIDINCRMWHGREHGWPKVYRCHM
jgi:proline racemase